MIKSTEHYGARYLGRERWMSFVYQVAALSDLHPTRVAEIGVGPGVVGNMIRATYPECRYTAIDIDPALRPDVTADVTALPFADGTFDAVFCCQVLEHLPYDRFVPALTELKRIVTRRVVISLPDVSLFFYLRFTGARRPLPMLWRGLSFWHPAPRVHDFASHGQHYWEIGVKGYPLRRVLDGIAHANLHVRDHFRMVERSYWHFFILDAA